MLDRKLYKIKNYPSSRVELYFGVTNEQEAQEWLEEFIRNIE
jgi:hypothetical protein